VSGSPEWERLSRLFDEALEQPASERVAWLAAACGTDAALRSQLERMLAAHSRIGPLDRPLPNATPDLRTQLATALADRYELEEVLGVGGMATVFLAHERKHDRKVVLKVLQPALAAAIGPARFLDEVRIAARLSHPHILALLDSGEVDGLLYYVMPYVGGETLRERLARDGALGIGDAVGVLRDVADALAHAHAGGVIHRDLKPDNILSVGAHAFLLDFGVAKLESDASANPGTNPGLAIGTPGYMAPEQAAAQPVDHRVDLYAWGLLAREILTGDRAPEPALLVRRPEVPRSLAALIEACLAVDPEERPATARSLVAALDGLVAPLPERRRGRWTALAAVAALVVAGGVVLQRDATAARTALGPIAVAPFRDETGDSALAGWGRLAGDWVTQGLHEAGLLPVVPWPAMLLAADVHERSGATDLTATVRAETGARIVVVGSYYRVGDSLHFQASLTDAEQGRLLVATPPVVVARDSATAGIRQMRERVMGALAVLLDERTPPESFTAHPPTWEAYRVFDRGMTEFNRYEYTAAEASMVEAWRRDTTFLPPLVLAAFAAVNEGDTEHADSVLGRALARRAGLSPYHAALADYLQAYLSGDRGRALPAILRAVHLAPGSRATYNAAYVLIQLNRPAEADSILATLDPDRGPMRDWPSYWSQRAYAAHLLGDHARELGYARAMRQRHPDQRVSWVIEARALAAMGRTAELDSLMRVAATLAPDVYWSQGAMLSVAGSELAAHQQGDSLAYFAQADAWFGERLRHDSTNRSHRSWRSQAKLGLGDWQGAEALLDGLDREGPVRIFHRGQLATLAARRGDMALAQARLGPSPRRRDGEYEMYQARIAALRGDSEEAIARLSTAMRLGVYNFHWMQHDARQDFAVIAKDARYRRLMGLDGER
jgi:TolB-like protein